MHVRLKEAPIAYLFWFLAGPFGAHKFYLGEPSWGVLYFFTGGLFFVGWFVDFFTIPAQVRRANLTSSAVPPLPERRAARIPDMQLRSTFPLDETAIAHQALQRVLTDPITWVPFVPAVAGYTIFDLPALFSLFIGVLAIGGVGAYWQKNWSRITDALRREAIAAHNRAQDAALKDAADELRRNCFAAYADKLEQFLLVKRQVEQRIYEDGAVTAQKMQIERLVDALCFGVRDQLAALAARERIRDTVDRQAALAQVETAFATLQTTAAELDTILSPSAPLADGGGISLEEVTRRLREEAEIARRVQARLRSQAHHDDRVAERETS